MVRTQAVASDRLVYCRFGFAMTTLEKMTMMTSIVLLVVFLLPHLNYQYHICKHYTHSLGELCTCFYHEVVVEYSSLASWHQFMAPQL